MPRGPRTQWIPAYAGMTTGFRIRTRAGIPANAPTVIPAKAGIHGVYGAAIDAAGHRRQWIPAFAGMTNGGPSFPRRRESIARGRRRQWIPACAGMTVWVVGDDGVGGRG
ncbi:hypothetical protein GCM10028862_01850 [Luteimonas pelagia]